MLANWSFFGKKVKFLGLKNFSQKLATSGAYNPDGEFWQAASR
jgi:hypothetical protein